LEIDSFHREGKKKEERLRRHFSTPQSLFCPARLGLRGGWFDFEGLSWGNHTGKQKEALEEQSF
jgi:hypothetical protein